MWEEDDVRTIKKRVGRQTGMHRKHGTTKFLSIPGISEAISLVKEHAWW
jgi:hypothetical protein